MATSIIFYFGIILLIAFILKSKNLHYLEMCFVWMSSFFIFASITFLLSLNYSLIHVSPEMNGFLANEVFRILIVPLSVTWLVDLNAAKGSLKKILLSSSGFVLYMMTFDYILEDLKFVIYKEPLNLWWSAVIYSSLILIIILLRLAFYNLLKKEVIS